MAIFIWASTEAQNVAFSLKKLEDISSQLPSDYFANNDTIIPCPDLCKNKSIVILHNDKGQVSHIGISLFSKETKEILNQAICDFIERAFLELALESDDKAVLSMLDRNKINIMRNGINFGKGSVTSIKEVLQKIEEPVTFSLNKKGLDSYTAAWEYGNNLLTFNFPSNRELILGINKKESDDILHLQLKENYCNDTYENNGFISADNRLVQSPDPAVFINKGDTFILKLMNEDTYYKKTKKGYELIFDRQFPTESLSNLFFGHQANNNLKIRVKHSMYGNFSPEFEMKFSDFICFFKDDFKIYTASYVKGGELHSTIVFQNRNYNYIHLLKIKTTEDNVFNKNGVLTASFNSNIPQHNISNLIGDMIKQ